MFFLHTNNRIFEYETLSSAKKLFNLQKNNEGLTFSDWVKGFDKQFQLEFMQLHENFLMVQTKLFVATTNVTRAGLLILPELPVVGIHPRFQSDWKESGAYSFKFAKVFFLASWDNLH